MEPSQLFIYAKGNINDGVVVRPSTYNSCTLGKEHGQNTTDDFVLFRVFNYGAPAESCPHDTGAWREVSRELTEAILQAINRSGIPFPPPKE